MVESTLRLRNSGIRVSLELVPQHATHPLADEACANAAAQVGVVLTIDTEPDNAWVDHQNPSVANVQGLLRLQELLDEFGAKATLLVTSRVIDDNAALATLQRMKDRGAEIGTHLHPWETPPFLDSGVDVRHACFPHDLPLSLIESKIAQLTERITSRIGRPTSYRAGRWGFCSEHLPILERLRYEVDTSVTPLIDWRDTWGIPATEGGRGGADFRSALRTPYYPSYADVRRAGSSTIVEVPVTAACTGPARRWLSRRYHGLPNLLRRGFSFTRLGRVVAATPAEETSRSLRALLDVLAAQRPPIINLTIHSSELVLGGSPNTETPADVDRVFSAIREMLADLSGLRGIVFQTLTDAARAWARESASPAVSGAARASTAAPQGRMKYAYILAASHSGSTLQAMLLNAHPDICTAGELKATNLGDTDAYLCSCGERIRLCRFWQAVSEAMRRRGFEFDITRSETHFADVPSRFAERLMRPLHAGPALEFLRDAALSLSPAWRASYAGKQQRNAALVASLLEVSGKKIVADSSKIAVRLKYLLRNPELDVHVVRQVRDGRAVMLTYMDPYRFADAADPSRRAGGTGRDYTTRRTAEQAAYLWLRSNLEAEAALRRVSPDRRIIVRYEDLCGSTESTLQRVYGFLGVDASRRAASFRSVAHHVVGNGMRLDTTSEIRLDDRWKSVLTKSELADFDRVAGKLNRFYGYL